MTLYGSYRAGVGWSVLAAVFAAAFLVPYRFAVEEVPRGTAMTAMFASAALFNAAVALAQDGRRALGFGWVSVGAAVGLATLTIIGNFGIAYALPRIGAGMISAVMKAQVVLTPLLALPLLGERAPRRLWAGALLALLGFALPQLAAAEAGSGSGYAFGFVAALAFAGMQILTRRVIERIRPASVNALRLLMAVLVLHLLPEGRAVWSAGPAAWGYAALAGLFGPGISRLCLMAAVRHVSPSLTALIALFGPVLAFGMGFVFFGTRPTGLELAGAVLIIAGVLWPLLPGLRRAEPSGTLR